jgi:hypothetical protein
MKKVFVRLTASAIAIIVAVVMVVSVSYAWLTISENPAVNGISVMIGGGNTILLAPDIVTVDDNGDELHYPGSFSNSLVLSKYDTYNYLNEVSGLEPVSTVDGINWIIPSYDSETGELTFSLDNSLSYANRTEKSGGNYIYMDFWIVSPGTECDIRVSTDTNTEKGSYLLELPIVTETDDGFTLSDSEGIIESSARVGFLINSDVGDDESMLSYAQSAGYDTKYKTLLGDYSNSYSTSFNFTIYEPNGTIHPSGKTADGEYVITTPMSWDFITNKEYKTDVSDRLTVQKGSSWKKNGDHLSLEEFLQTAIFGKENLTEKTADALFYNAYLQGQTGEYALSGAFYKNTEKLYSDTYSEDATLDSNNEAGATDDVIIASLQRNVPQRVRMFIWIEGQDPDCTNTDFVAETKFSLGLELSGSTK